jgi:methyl-accepting chemotaxis protein
MTEAQPGLVTASRKPEITTAALNPMPAWRQRILRMPLIGKLLGANMLIALAALSVSAVFGHPGLFALVCLALGVSFVANALLVRLALLPLDGLQEVAQQVSEGDFSARVAESPIADRQISELGESFNRLLSRVESRHRGGVA